MDRTDSKVDTPVARGSSRPVRYELIDKDGNAVSGKEFDTAHAAGRYAQFLWPDQEQDEERTGKGWDVQVANETAPY